MGGIRGARWHGRSSEGYTDHTPTAMGKFVDSCPRRSYLDPRPLEEAVSRPIHDTVNIPLSELPGRTNELPPREKTVRIVGPPGLVDQAILILEGLGRKAEPAKGEFSEGTDPSLG